MCPHLATAETQLPFLLILLRVHFLSDNLFSTDGCGVCMCVSLCVYSLHLRLQLPQIGFNIVEVPRLFSVNVTPI